LRFQDSMYTDNNKSIKGTPLAFIGFSIAVCISLTVIQYGIRPQWENMSVAYSRLIEVKGTLAEKNIPEVLEKRLTTLHDSLDRNFKELSQEFGETKDLPAILRMLIEKANASDIQFIKMQPTSESASGKTGAYPIVLEMTTTYHSLGRFVSTLEAVPNLVHIDRIAITASTNATLGVRIQVTCYLQ
jgi:Tfp pilus assembly protein PilO